MEELLEEWPKLSKVCCYSSSYDYLYCEKGWVLLIRREKRDFGKTEILIWKGKVMKLEKWECCKWKP
ncbi:hypothetical protein F3Y22_tig00110293pilonHSYRG00044 [Hibiscus syriacus]|uniref:Uncharacterized protein n=1 Tax=Hibiscus syriacus TaxID=106335 RepID=A0A6A3B5D9_HIBSY|nr:hypothetical protein F3Y22_tig00110293pilonHSYRG00044 [Hibiscus syriacus]